VGSTAAASGLNSAAQTIHAAPAGSPGQCVVRPIVLGCWRRESVSINPGRRQRWLTPHRSTSRSNADCRPLLQQSHQTLGGSFSQATELLATNNSTLCAALIDTPFAPPQVPQENNRLPLGFLGPRCQCQQLHPHANDLVEGFMTPGRCLGVFGWQWLRVLTPLLPKTATDARPAQTPARPRRR